MFSGTACQIAGLNGYLQKEYDNLLTIDVLCHGVPSPKVWKKYLEKQEQLYDATVNQVNFRNKKLGWKSFNLVFKFSNGKLYERVFNQDIFMRLFLSDICLRPSCHECRFKGMDRPSDITLGDCWGVEKHSPEMDDNKGTSVILIHSSKGEQVFNAIKTQLNYKEMELDIALPPSADSRKSVLPHPKREKFFKELDEKDIVELSKLIKTSLFTRIKRKLRKILIRK